MQLYTDYQQFIINMINEYENQKCNINPLHQDVFYSLRTNPIRFYDYKMILHYFHGQNIIIQKYLIEPKFIYGNDEHERNIIMSTLYLSYKYKYKKEPALNQKMIYKEYIYTLETQSSITRESEIFIVSLSNLVNLILSSESQKEFNDKYKFEVEKINCKSSIQSNSPFYNQNQNQNKYLIPQNLLNYEAITRIFQKGYRHSWNLLIEYIINNIQFLSNTRTIPKNLKYKNENIGLVYNNLSKQLSSNSQYRPFKYDFIEIISQLGLQFNDIDINDLVSATQFKQ